MKDTKPVLFLGFLWLFILALALAKINKQKDKIAELEDRPPVIIYTVDNAGVAMVGKITDKEIIEGRYTVTVEAYGRFLVTKEQYDAIKVGDPAPEFLKKRGS